MYIKYLQFKFRFIIAFVLIIGRCAAYMLIIVIIPLTILCLNAYMIDWNVGINTLKDWNVGINTFSVSKIVNDTSKSNETLKYINFAICSSFWEQQTNALYNMWSFQKWANITGFRTLEPFAQNSNLKFTNQILYNYNFSKSLLFSDYYDLKFWNKMTKNYGIRPLEKWSEYVHSTLRETVVAILIYLTSQGGVFVDDDIDKNNKCVAVKKEFYNQHAFFFSKLQIEVVRNVCFVFKHPFSLSLLQFNSYIILDNVNVWFSEWRGIWHNRIHINDHKELERTYGGKEKIQTMVKASPRIIRDSRKYVNVYLNADFNKYTTVAFRTGNRKILLVVQDKYSRKDVIEYFYKCAEEVKNALLKYHSNHTFLAIDLGRFGDLTAYKYFQINNDGNKLFELMLNIVYSNKSIDEYHSELIRAANGIEDSGYIGSMQKTIAENGERLIVVGGYSNFQASMVEKFQAKNQGCQDCVIPICYAGPEMPWA